MSRVTDILDRARDTLGDTNPDRYRYETSALLRLLNDGLDDLAVHSRLFRGFINIPLVNLQAVYSLPEDAIGIRTVLYDGKKLPIKSTAYMDEQVDLNWRSRTTENALQFVVFDREDSLNFRTFPVPKGEFETGYVLTPGAFGVTDTIDEFTDVDTFGVISEITGMNQLLDNELLYVIYDRKPAHVTTTNDDLELPPMYDKMLKYYVTGHALRNDVESQNRQFGGEELQFYFDWRNTLTTNAATDNTPSDSFRTVYRGMG